MPVISRHLVIVWAALQMRLWMLRDRIDAVVGFLGLPYVLLTLAVLTSRVRLVARRSCVWGQLTHIDTYKAQLAHLAQWQRLLGWRAARIICNTHQVAEGVHELEGWPTDRIAVIPPGWPERPRTEYSSKAPYYVARPREEKAVDAATREMAKRGVPLALSHDPPDWSQVGILVHCSPVEAMSNAVAMACAHGIPVLAWDLPGNVALVGKHNTVPAGDWDAMAKRVQWLRYHIDWRRVIGGDLRRKIQEEYSLGAMVNRWEEVLRA
jgi:hypothetical protein